MTARTPGSTPDDRAAIAALRDAFVAADLAGDADAMSRLLAEDVVILHPECGVIEGREQARTFMRQVLDEVHAAFEKRASYETLELHVSGDLAYERGILTQALTPKGGGAGERDEGMYLWIFGRDGQRAWRIARIAGTITHLDEPADLNEQIEPQTTE